VTVLLTGDIR